ncbi:ribonuclease H-like domain-containing protein [Tanacetum coccineum]
MSVYNSVHNSLINSDHNDDVQDPNPVPRISKLDISNPLHLHPNDTTVVTVVSIKLKGIENYQVWLCAMLLALEGKNKIGFIAGSCKRSNIDEVLGKEWDRNDSSIADYYQNKSSQSFKKQNVFNNYSVGKSSSFGFTDEQMATLISLIKNNKVGKNVQANMAGANQHMTYTDKELDNVFDISHLKIKVGHPNRTKAYISKIGNIILSNDLTLYDVMVIPKYCVILIYVYKLAKENKGKLLWKTVLSWRIVECKFNGKITVVLLVRNRCPHGKGYNGKNLEYGDHGMSDLIGGFSVSRYKGSSGTGSLPSGRGKITVVILVRDRCPRGKDNLPRLPIRTNMKLGDEVEKLWYDVAKLGTSMEVLEGSNDGSGRLIEGRLGERCGGNGGRGSFMSGVGEGKVDSMGGMLGGLLAIRSMVSNDVGAGGGEVNGGGVDFRVSKRLLLEVAGEMIGERGGIEVREVGGGERG